MYWIKKHYILSAFISAAVIGLVAFFVMNSEENGIDEYTVSRMDVIESVDIAGTVRAEGSADLSFESSGNVVYLPVEIGMEVREGDVLARQDTSELEAELADARAEVDVKLSEIENAEENLAKVKAKHDTLVENARRTLLSSDIEAVPNSDSSTLTAPIITGLYMGEEGQYKLEFEDDVNDVNELTLEVFGLERFDGIVQEVRSNPLGTRGLYIRLPSGISNYKDTIWSIDIPNKKGDSYADNLNDYESALEDREVALQEARAKVDPGSLEYSITQSELKQARSMVDRILSQINRKIIRAPFDGTISAVEIERGEVANAGEDIVSVISSGDFEVKLDVPEIDVAKVKPGDAATIKLDAFGDDVSWKGTLVSISRGESYVDGVPVFEATANFDNGSDSRVRSGMNATVSLITQERKNVLAVPRHFVDEDSQGSFVQIVTEEGGLEKRYVETGLKGSDGTLEIIEGVEEGDTIGI